MRTVISEIDIDRFMNETPININDNIYSEKYRIFHRNNEISEMKPDSYSDRLIKYIPTEVIALYLTLDALIRSSQINYHIYWFIFVFCIFATFLYLWRIEKVFKISQILISVVAFCVWVFALGGPFAFLNWYNPIYGAILLPIYTFLIAIVEAK